MRGNGTKRPAVMLGVLLTVSLVLATVDHRGGDDSPMAPARLAAARVIGPAEGVVASAVRPVNETIQALAAAPTATRRIRELERANAGLARALGQHRHTDGKRADVDRMLARATVKKDRLRAANVIAWRGAPGFTEAVEIDAGTGEGVEPDMAVVNGDGLVGRVVRSAPHSSTVALLSDTTSSVGARVESSKELGVIHGLGKEVPGGRLLRLQLLDSTAKVEPGERIVSFGSRGGRPYSAGIPIGVVNRVVPTPGELTRTAFAQPYVKFTALDTVGVVVR